MVANLHADERYPLSLGQTLEVGHGWLPGASADHLLVALPTVFDPELEWLSDRDAQRALHLARADHARGSRVRAQARSDRAAGEARRRARGRGGARARLR